MGCMGLRSKGNNLCFLTDLQFVQCLVILFGLFNLSVCLFEDQIGKFDWKQNYVGQIKFAHFDTVSTAKKIIIATEENVVAALNLKSGQVLWRQVLERAQQGQIQYMHVDSEVTSVSGINPWLVRTWDPTTGRLLSEWSVTLATHTSEVHWFVSDGKLYQVVPNLSGSHIELTSYNVQTGQNKGTTTKITAPWMTDLQRCVLTGSIYACTSGSDSNSNLYYIDLAKDTSYVKTYPIQSFIGSVSGEVSIAALNGITAGIVLTRNNVHRVVLLDAAEPKALTDSIIADGAGSLLTMDKFNEKILLHSSVKDSSVIVSAISLEHDVEVEDIKATLDISLRNAKLCAAICATKRDGNLVCRYLLSTADEALVLVQNSGKVLWTREEALSNIVAVDLLDLPVSDLDASIETEFNNKEGDFIGMLTRRLSSQMKQFRLLLLTLLGSKTSQSAAQQADLVRDEFGLHKIIVVATRCGKLFGIDNLSGKILWKKHLYNIMSFAINEKPSMFLYVQRTARHLPRPARCAIIAKDKITSNGVIYTFNPINGEPVGNGLERLPYRIKQAMLVHKMNEEFVRPLLVLDHAHRVHVFADTNKPSLSLETARQTYMYAADVHTGILQGYTLAYSTTEEQLVATVTWQLKLGTKEHRIKDVVGKNPLERVHSQGRVLIDRSVLYKYVNPNLVAVVTHGSDPIHKYVSNVYLVDVVSGVIISSISHKRAREPIHVVHSENWLVYSYFNDKWRRTEIGTLELYEGKTQTNDTAFSSLAPPQLPMMERQSYILSSHVESMQVTLTEKGITSKHVLMALGNGGVIEMPWMFLDPRRPATVTPEMREEGVVPYIPELPLPNEAVINYNQSLSRITGIHTSPSGLESTCLVLVHGLDIFYTRIAPSKTFDLLKDDFDYYLIVIVLAALLLASYITKQLASRKALKQAWK